MIDALCKIPLDANRADSFLLLPEKLGNAMEMDHPATMVFAHWPGHVCPWYDDLRRIFSYSKVLGSFCTLEEYFQEAAATGQRVKFNADQYRSPYLVQDVAANRADSISRWVRLLSSKVDVRVGSNDVCPCRDSTRKCQYRKQVCGLEDRSAKNSGVRSTDSLNRSEPNESGLDQELQQTFDAAVKIVFAASR